MRIVLVRHGKPSGVDTRPISGRDLGRWVRHYDESGITKELPPPLGAREATSAAGCVLVSDLLRAKQSAAWLVASTG